jgi:hypothetical protein
MEMGREWEREMGMRIGNGNSNVNGNENGNGKELLTAFLYYLYPWYVPNLICTL